MDPIRVNYASFQSYEPQNSIVQTRYYVFLNGKVPSFRYFVVSNEFLHDFGLFLITLFRNFVIMKL